MNTQQRKLIAAMSLFAAVIVPNIKLERLSVLHSNNHNYEHNKEQRD